MTLPSTYFDKVREKAKATAPKLHMDFLTVLGQPRGEARTDSLIKLYQNASHDDRAQLIVMMCIQLGENCA